MEIRNEIHFTSLKDVVGCTSCVFVDVSISTSVVLSSTKIICMEHEVAQWANYTPTG